MQTTDDGFVRLTPRRVIAAIVASSVLALILALSVTLRHPAGPATGTLPAELSDRQFWSLSTELSEPEGSFRSENLVSNEQTFQQVIPALVDQVRPDGVYLGVAPDQNFTYILATKPRMAFILDIRRGNLLEHLMYKAVIELSADRAEFVSRLFSRPRPPNLPADAPVIRIFAEFDRSPPSELLYRQNLAAIHDHLCIRRGFPLSDEDLARLDEIYLAFFSNGPNLRYTATAGAGRRGGGNFPTYGDLMMQTDRDGVYHGYLATEDQFRRLKDLEEKNLIVPVVGDFAGPRALRAIGQYIREHQSIVSAFYVSNVEQYLFQDGVFSDFARSVATLPVDGTSTFIRSVSRRSGYPGRFLAPDGRASALDPIEDFISDFQAQRIRLYYDVNARSR